MKKKFIYSIILIAIIAFSIAFAHQSAFADIREANDSTNWLNITLDTDDTDYDVSEHIVGFIVKLNYEGTPVNETFSYTKQWDGSEENSTITFNNGEARVSSKGADINFIIKLPTTGYTYSVTENSGPGLDIKAKEGTKTEGKNGGVDSGVSVDYKATVKKFNLKIQMHAYGDLEDFEYPFKIFFHPGQIKPRHILKYSGDKSGTLEEDPWEMGILNISLKNNEYVIVEGLPDFPSIWFNEFEYNTFIELNQFEVKDYFQPALFSTSSIINNMEDYTMHLQVDRKIEKLVIKKCFEGIGEENNKEYTIKIKGWVPFIRDENVKIPITGEYPYTIFETNNENEDEEVAKGKVTFNEEGIAYIKIKSNQKIQIGENYVFVDEEGKELEDQTRKSYVVNNRIKYQDHAFLLGSKFEIEEVEADNYIQEQDIKEKTVYEKNIIYTITNTRKFTGKLTINKIVKNNKEDSAKEFKFKIKLTDSSENLPKEYNYTGSKEGTIQFDDNFEAEITLKHEDNITIEGLPVGAQYIITEDDYKKDGYVTVSEKQKGTISEEGAIATFTNIPKEVYIRKVDISGTPIEGVKLIVKDENNQIIDEWITTKEPHKLSKGFELGKKYFIVEEYVPDGYIKSDPKEFIISETEEELNVELKNDYTKVRIKKVNEDGEYVVGATFVIKDEKGNIVEQWITKNKDHLIIAKLRAGEKYILEETQAPDGYKLSNSKEFIVSADGSEDVIEIVDMKKDEEKEEEEKEEEQEEENKEKTKKEEPEEVQTGDKVASAIAILSVMIAVYVFTKYTSIIFKKNNKK